MTATIPVARALVCLSCDALIDVTATRCPACGSAHAWPLAKWIGERGKERAA